MKKSVAIVEDEPFIIEALTFLLENEGLGVSAISDGAEAINFIIKSKPDLVILDIMLPNVSGMKILEDIRAIDEISHLPVLMLTAFSQRDLVERARNAGVMAYVVKPFSINDLTPAIELMRRKPLSVISLAMPIK